MVRTVGNPLYYCECLFNCLRRYSGGNSLLKGREICLFFLTTKLSVLAGSAKVDALLTQKNAKTSNASQAQAHLQTKYKISVTLGGANENKYTPSPLS